MAMRPMTTRAVYVAEHERFAEIIRAYSLTPKGMRVVPDAVVREQFEASASLLLAMNVKSRIAFTDALNERLPALVRPSRRRGAHFITITQRRFTYDLTSRRRVDLDRMRRWFSQIMLSLTYFGIIEVALYRPASREMAMRLGTGMLASWHFHAVVWDADGDDIVGLRQRLRGEYSGIPGFDPLHIKPIASDAGLIAQLTYMGKAPIRIYRAGSARPEPDAPVAPWIRKATPRPTEALKLCQLMLGITIEQLCLEGGKAVGTTQKVLRAARRACRVPSG